MDDRIELAEWQEWTETTIHGQTPVGTPPSGTRTCLPDPSNNAADCEELIRFLNSKGFEVDVLHWPEGDATVMVKRSAETHGPDKAVRFENTVSDYKQGVVELALKIKRQE